MQRSFHQNKSMKEIPNTRFRKIRTWVPSQKVGEFTDPAKGPDSTGLIDLASNDYLGLSQNSRLREAAQNVMFSQGVGAGGSRLVTGSRPIHKQLEEELSIWLGFDKVLLFPSGFQANLAAVSALANRNTPVIVDKLIHNSLLIGIKASGAKLKRFAHNDLNDLERLIQICLKQHPNQTPLVITESLFSMEGTSPNLQKLANLCKEYSVRLFVDEAHALGVMGREGKGLCYGISKSITMISGTFGKAFGSGGAFLATNNFFGEHLIQTSGAFRYTTALAPPLAAAALEALNLIKANPHWGVQLQEKANRWRLSLAEEGWDYPQGNGPIIPLILGSDEITIEKQNHLENNGLLTIAIRPPTVPEGTSRLRIVVRNTVPDNTLDKLLLHLRDKR